MLRSVARLQNKTRQVSSAEDANCVLGHAPPPLTILKSRGSETFPQYIHLILAGFILTNPIFSRDYFLN